MANKRKPKPRRPRAKKSTRVSAFSPEQMRELNQLFSKALKDKPEGGKS